MIFPHKSFIVRRLQIALGYARGSLLVLRKNLLRSRILPNCMVTATDGVLNNKVTEEIRCCCEAEPGPEDSTRQE